MDFMSYSNHPAAQCLPVEILEATQKRAHYFRSLYQNQGLEVTDFLGDLYLLWAENPDMDPDILVAKLNSKVRRDNLQDKIAKSALAADIFFDAHDHQVYDDDQPPEIAGPESDNEDMENLLLRAKAEDEMQEIMAFAMSKFGLGLKRKTISDYIRKDMQGFIALAKNGIAERKKAGVRWQGYEKKCRGRPAHFELEQAINIDPFAPKRGEYYKSPDRYNSLRKIRRERKRNIKKNQLELAI
jgi:hypothetical protein